MENLDRESSRKAINTSITTILLILILMAGAFLRFRGLFWGEYQYLHPDERFLVWVGSDIEPVGSLAEYWDTHKSSLNPHNRGHGFYVYGTLPMFVTRYLVEWIYGHSGFNEMTNVGRSLSALVDLLTVFVVYLIGRWAYNRWIGLVASAFSAFAVLQIQHAHFFTMDSFTTFFAVLTIYFAVRVAREKGLRHNPDLVESDHPVSILPEDEALSQGGSESRGSFFARLIAYTSTPLFNSSLGFGIALGMAVASKVNAAPLGLLLPVAVLIRYADLEGKKQREILLAAFPYLVLAGVTSILVFRIFQPYAFSGPGFFGLKPNPAWLANLNELRNQASGNVDFPPALQWARRPVWFALQNMVLWGMGLPFGLVAWAGFTCAGWQILKGSWRKHFLLWIWTAFYFTWQSLIFNPSMRYQLLIYPILAVFAGWVIYKAYSVWGDQRGWVRYLSLGFGLLALILTAAYAFAFSNIYVRPITRIAASRWIYQNIPGPINLPIETSQGIERQIVPYPYNLAISKEVPFVTGFIARYSGQLNEIYLGRLIDPTEITGLKDFQVTISEQPGGGGQNTRVNLEVGTALHAEGVTARASAESVGPFLFNQGQEYFLELRPGLGQGPVILSGELNLDIVGESQYHQTIALEKVYADALTPFPIKFVAESDGVLQDLTLSINPQPTDQEKKIILEISRQPDGSDLMAHASYSADFIFAREIKDITLPLSNPVHLNAGEEYFITIKGDDPLNGVILRGTAIANEGAWDDGLPVRLDGYDGFGGIYEPGLNFDMYEDDNPNKLSRFYNILDATEYILISSSRQWGSLPRLPERFPMTREYYRRLIGCPPDRTVEWCYNVAQPGMFYGDLGFDLIEVFDSGPSIGPFVINDQPAEEAFTVYDHPKVFIFQKRPDYDPARVRAILGTVDLSRVIHITPKEAESLPRDPMLPASRLERQRNSGTWIDLFNPSNILNALPFLGVVVWYLVLFLLGVLVYPLLRFSLPGLTDHGYPLARTAGLLILSYLVWLAGSAGIPTTRLLITIAVVIIALSGALLYYRQRNAINEEVRQGWRYYLIIEILFMAFFIFDLLIRLGNPDLWHPWKGGEKPMDFSYFNAVLKSITYPPYDPWFAGGYINYYYYGFLLVGVLVKWLGITPSIAYNLIIPTIFAMIAMGAFSLVWNLVSWKKVHYREWHQIIRSIPFIAGFAGALGMAVLGNLGIVRMIYQGYQRLAAPGGNIDSAGIITRFVWAGEGMLRVLGGEALPYGIADWYWNPSRVIPAPNDVEPITEFPFFTVLYGDPHAHLFALPITLLALAWSFSVVLGQGWESDSLEKPRQFLSKVVAGFLLGGLAIGALRTINTWDLPTYLGLGMLAVGYTVWRNFADFDIRMTFLRSLPKSTRRAIYALAMAILLALLALIFFYPYSIWYVQGYTDVDIWRGSHTPVWSYLTHWGLFLFLIGSWMVLETRDWMAKTPLSELRRLEPYKGLILTGVVAILVWIIIFLVMGVSIAWLVLPMVTWAVILLFRPEQTNGKKVVLVLFACGLLLTLMVEIIVLVGDIGRMNTVFKFYLQVWTLFALSAAACFSWLIKDLPTWLPSWRAVWKGALVFLLAGAALYPVMGGIAKIKDRMVLDAPHSLDGMAYLQSAMYDDLGVRMDLSQDYRAIRWMQEHVVGTPVIIEGNMVEYHWSNRFTIYTGLPNVIGWNWHQRQQRARWPESTVPTRITDVNEFYLTTDETRLIDIIKRYRIEYIILGQLERALYPGPGLDKFEALNGHLWQAVYRDGEMVIYRVQDSVFTQP